MYQLLFSMHLQLIETEVNLDFMIILALIIKKNLFQLNAFYYSKNLEKMDHFYVFLNA